MRRLATLFFVFLFISGAVYSQNDTSTSTPNPDDDFNVFLLVFASIVISLMAGAALAGAIIATGFLFLMAAFVALGIVSVSILAGIYNRSLTSGFKTFLYIFCPVVGMVMGSTGFYIVIRLFDLDISGKSALLAGIIGGSLGGLLMAFVVSKIVRVLSRYLLNKISSPKEKGL